MVLANRYRRLISLLSEPCAILSDYGLRLRYPGGEGKDEKNTTKTLTKLGDYAPEKDTEAAIETRRALLMLIGGKNRSGLVSRTELLEKADSRWTEDEIKRNKSTNNLNVDEIQKWLTGTRVPTNNKVWTLGECLHDAGYQWASGLLLLWNCGRLTHI